MPRFLVGALLLVAVCICAASPVQAGSWKTDFDLDEVRRYAGEALPLFSDATNAWHALVLLDPKLIDGDELSTYERLVLFLADRATAENLVKGMSPAAIELTNGDTLERFIQQRVTEGGSRPIISRYSGRCLDVKSASTANGANVQQYSCHGGANQAWDVVAVTNMDAVLIAEHSGKCLDVKGASTATGAYIQQFSCHFGTNQRWEFFQGFGSDVFVEPLHSNRCMAVSSRSNGGNVKQRNCVWNDQRMWDLGF